MTGYIRERPQRYAQWLECFNILRSRFIDAEEYAVLCSGSCEDSAVTLSYFEEQLIETVNVMLLRSIRAFERELGLYSACGEIENLHIPYVRFAGRARKCMFFTGLDFMSERFRKELTDSLRSETERFWKRACRSLYDACTEQHNELLEDELYLVRRMRLFQQDKENYE